MSLESKSIFSGFEFNLSSNEQVVVMAFVNPFDMGVFIEKPKDCDNQSTKEEK